MHLQTFYQECTDNTGFKMMVYSPGQDPGCCEHEADDKAAHSAYDSYTFCAISGAERRRDGRPLRSCSSVLDAGSVETRTKEMVITFQKAYDRQIRRERLNEAGL